VGQVVRYVAGQVGAAGEIATDRQVVVETFEDALGDPRLVVHSPFGGRVNGPWGIALAHAIRERLGVEPQVITGDDGILLRFGDAGEDGAGEGNTREGDAGERLVGVERLVASLTSAEAKERLLAELPNSAVFGAQFRMNAARALLLPRERAGKRTPLWLSRLRAKDLLQAVGRFDDFPILLETYRDCLRDVMDLDGLTEVLDRISRGEIRVSGRDSEVPSPVAMGLDYRMAMQYVYEYDAPRGERQLAALSLNRALLADLLQDGTLADLLKPEAVAEVTARVGRTAPEGRARSAEELAQLLYEMGDLSDAEIAERCAPAGAGGAPREWTRDLAAAGRLVPRVMGGEAGAAATSLRRTTRTEAAASSAALTGWGRQAGWPGGEWRWVHAERLAEYDALAQHPLPVLRRRLMHSGPATAGALARRYGLEEEAVTGTLRALGEDVVAGRFAPGGAGEEGEEQWVDRRNLEQMHRRTLTLLRREVRPVPLSAYAELLRRWQGAGASPGAPGTGGQGDRGDRAALNRVLQQLRGVAVPGVAWERDVLPARLRDFDPAALAERCAAGEVMWVAEGGKDARRARVRFFFRGEGGLFLERRPDGAVLEGLSPPAHAVYDFLAAEGAALLADVAEATELRRAEAQEALVELVLAGLVTNDTLAALRAVLGYDPPPAVRPRLRSSLEVQLSARLRGQPHRMTPGRLREARRRAREVAFGGSGLRGYGGSGASGAGGTVSGWTGRWSIVHRPSLLGKPTDEGERSLRQARQLLARWGVVTKAALERESQALRWEALSPALAHLELRGEARRGYFVEGLPGLQYALPEVVERLRAVNGEQAPAGGEAGQPGSSRTDGSRTVVLSGADPAQLFGTDAFGGPLRFQRVASTAVALVQGEPVAAFEDSGASAVVDSRHPALVPALRALARWWAARRPGAERLKLERWAGEPVLAGPGAPFLEAAGFVRDAGAMLWIGDPGD
jgi:ATP-dependent Lhr-like helicase